MKFADDFSFFSSYILDHYFRCNVNFPSVEIIRNADDFVTFLP